MFFYHVTFICQQLVQYSDVRPWFAAMGGEAFFTALLDIARARVEVYEHCFDAERQLSIVLEKLAKEVNGGLTGDAEHMFVTIGTGPASETVVFKGSRLVQQPQQPQPVCAAPGCQVTRPGMKVCGSCKVATYCCQECQQKGCARSTACFFSALLFSSEKSTPPFLKRMLASVCALNTSTFFRQASFARRTRFTFALLPGGRRGTRGCARGSRPPAAPQKLQR